MINNSDGYMNEDDFNFDDDFSDDDQDDFEKERNQTRSSPLFKKAMEIVNTVSALVESLDDEDKEMYEQLLLESAYILAPKIGGAMGSGSYIICMQNASIIRYHAEYLLTSTSGLKMFTNAKKDYVQVLREDMLEFQSLFKEWVSAFSQLGKEDYTDEWGLFLQ